MNPSTAGNGASPERHACSAAATTSRGLSILVFSANEIKEWKRKGSSVCIASCQLPNWGRTCEINASSRALASARSTGQRKVLACGSPKVRTPQRWISSHNAERSWQMRESSGAGGSPDQRLRFSASKFHFPPSGSPSGVNSTPC